MNRRDNSGASASTGPSSFTAFGLRAEAEPIAPGLHVVATPIGNLRDISLRALATLAAAEAVIAEDTRVTKTLLAHYGIATPLLAYHEHNAHLVRPQILARLRKAPRSRWCRTPARRSSPTPASSSWPRRSPPRSR